MIAKAVEIEKRFQVEVPDTYQPRFNAAPTQILPVITNEKPEGLSFFQWGLIPAWAKNKNIGSKLINARAESIAEKASFKNAFKSRRCLVITDGYYEWKRTAKKSKIPYRISIKEASLFSYAGLWETFEEDSGTIHSFTIITTTANKATSSIHDRMPVILDAGTEKIWLSQSNSENDLLELLKPYDAEKTNYYTVSNLVNSVQNDDERLVAPSAPMDQTGNYTLFD